MDRHTEFNNEVERLISALQHPVTPVDDADGSLEHSGRGKRLFGLPNECLQRTLAIGRGLATVVSSGKKHAHVRTEDRQSSDESPPARPGRRWSASTAEPQATAPEKLAGRRGPRRYRSAPPARDASAGQAGLAKALPPSAPPSAEGTLKSPPWLEALLREHNGEKQAHPAQPASGLDPDEAALKEWFRRLNLASYVVEFQKRGITKMSQFMMVSEDQLKGIVPRLSDRRQIAIALAKLHTDSATQNSRLGVSDVRLALLVGNSHYVNYPDAPMALADVEALGEVLRQQLNFRTLTVRNSTVSQLAAACQKVAAQSRDAQGPALLLYYSGHAVQIDGQNYLLPVDCPCPLPTNRFAGLTSLNQLVVDLAKGQPALSIVVVDACRGLPIVEAPPLGSVPWAPVLHPMPGLPTSPKVKDDPRPPGVGAPTGALRQGLAPFSLEAPNVCVLLAAAPHQLAAEGKQRASGSLFCHAVLRHIVQPGCPLAVTLQDISTDVQALTMQKQKPWMLYRASGPQFYFAPPEGVTMQRSPIEGQLPWKGWDV